MQTIINQLQHQRQDAAKALQAAQRRLTKAPERVTIFFKHVHGSLRCYRYTPGPGHRERYLSMASKRSEIISLADKRYCQSVAATLQTEIDALDQFLAAYKPEAKFAAHADIPAEIRGDIAPVIRTPQQRCRAWQAQTFETNGFEFKADSDIRTARGERVRSKSECIVADMLDRRGLAYHYEQRLPLQDGDVYPDFTIMHPVTCQLYYLEYFGMVDVPEYAARAFEKIARYQTAGLDPHLICLFESTATPLKSSTIDAVLKAHFGV